MKTLRATVHLSFDKDISTSESLDVCAEIQRALFHWRDEAGLAPEGVSTNKIEVSDPDNPCYEREFLVSLPVIPPLRHLTWRELALAISRIPENEQDSTAALQDMQVLDQCFSISGLREIKDGDILDGVLDTGTFVVYSDPRIQ